MRAVLFAAAAAQLVFEAPADEAEVAAAEAALRSEAALLKNPGVQDFLQSISTWDDVFAAADVSEVSDTGVTIDLQQPLTTAAPEPQPTLVPPVAMGSGRRRAVGLIFGGVLAASVATGVFLGWSNLAKTL